MATTPLQAWPIPEMTDLRGNVPVYMQALGTAIEKQSIMRFTTSTVRDAAVTAPVEGMVAYLTTPNALTWYDGTAWRGEWATYTPTDANITVGNGTRIARWKFGIDGMIDFQWSLLLGTTSAVAANAAVGLPRAVVTVAGLEMTISVRYLDNGTRHYLGGAVLSSAGTSAGLIHTEAGDSGVVSATSPFTWAVNDRIVVTGRYQSTP